MDHGFDASSLQRCTHEEGVPKVLGAQHLFHVVALALPNVPAFELQTTHQPNEPFPYRNDEAGQRSYQRLPSQRSVVVSS
jgi:hypothetical protein